MAGRISSGECPLQAGGVNLPQWVSARALVHPYVYCKRPHSSAGKMFRTHGAEATQEKQAPRHSSRSTFGAARAVLIRRERLTKQAHQAKHPGLGASTLSRRVDKINSGRGAMAVASALRH